jgi:hypothetical protein
MIKKLTPDSLKDLRSAYINQRKMAKYRGISWEFTFETWVAWWLTENRWFTRGNGRDQTCMARIGDVGPYSPSNVVHATNAENGQEKIGRAWTTAQRAAQRAGLPRTVGKPRAVITPKGEFPTVRAAAVHHGVSAPYIVKILKNGKPGWSYRE